ncbi:DUF3857 domain-containing protein [Lysobacter yangpyeongensis]|uniref:DUF3857 domain-containing protein n=1 Tax=Lysobacter yangpyeongensis TaxID=346182 RepID=A0ABW0SMT0_9GAMM
MLLALMLAGVAGAQEVEHARGEYRFSVGPEPAFAEPQEVPAQWDAKAPGAGDTPWRFWLFDKQIDRRSGHDQVYFDYVYEVKDTTLLGEAGRYQIGFNPDYQRLILHRVQLRRGGKWYERLVPDRISLARREEGFEQDLADGNVTALIVLDDVRVDDVVRVRYSIVGSNPILSGQLIDATTFAWSSPMLRTRLRVLYDPGRKPDVRLENGAPTPVIRQTDAATEVLFESARNAAYTDEGSYPVWYQPYPRAQVSQARRWSDVVDWALPLYPAQTAPLPADLEAHLAQWSKLADPQARVSAALRLVQEQVRYFGVEMGDNTHRPTLPAETWSRRYGDCKDKAYLLATLLQRMAIDAAPALTSIESGKGVANGPPAASAFDHVIVRAKVGDAVLWLDPTITSQGGAASDSDLSRYGVALPVVPGVTALQEIAPAGTAEPSIAITERYEPSDDAASARLSIRTVYRGPSADEARRGFASARPEETSRRYADYYRRRFGKLTVAAAPVFKDDLQANVLEVVEEYVLASPFEADGSLRYLDLYAEALGTPAQLPSSMERVGPLDLGMPAHYRQEVDVRIPERWVSTLGDETLDVESDAFKFTRDVSVEDRSVKVVFDMKVVDREVAGDKVGPHLAELRKVHDNLYARVTMKPAPAVRSKDRDARLKALLKNAIEDETQ